jgi:hypothetical protein
VFVLVPIQLGLLVQWVFWFGQMVLHVQKVNLSPVPLRVGLVELEQKHLYPSFLR